MKKNANKGFSLVELIIVIAIMAVLIGVLAPQFIKQVEKSRESTDLQNIEEIKTAVETYVAENGEDIGTGVTYTVTCPAGSIGKIVSSCKELDEYGIPDDGVANKSKKWVGTFTWTYNCDTYAWTAPTGVHATYYNADGTTVTSTSTSGS